MNELIPTVVNEENINTLKSAVGTIGNIVSNFKVNRKLSAMQRDMLEKQIATVKVIYELNSQSAIFQAYMSALLTCQAAMTNANITNDVINTAMINGFNIINAEMLRALKGR
ncbi:MAG: hypothetical protein IJX77_07930 [Ruminococcus sp.]|nr:hypothetical protein [Ruminococcus sp.]